MGGSTECGDNHCPQCGYDDSWGEYGCMDCGLEFFPPSEAYWDASTLTIPGRVPDLQENWGGPVARKRTRTPWDWCEPDKPEPPAPLPDSASHIEKLFWDAHRQLMLPELEGLVFQQQAGRYRMDFALPGRMIGIELDGLRNHSKTEDVARDCLRQRWLQGLGWNIIRFGGREVTQDAGYCVRQAAFFAGMRGKAAA